ncbi:hypothetical protein NLG97_g1791 [Lecanicillium saksenae]|uniref:Uncharacterized protein n=1 Tax=Lecanicillium saksenae TaxID=468837 RepID=A0ACC1R4H5_9HYPO|nr:hypothetical protein NLG97_g1791 [Lecanicillium saksenae]
MQSTSSAATPYREPEIQTILVQSSLILLLNTVNFVLDKAVYCGLLGQVFLGVAWGTPGGNWLGAHAEETIAQLGYLGLLLLVYEGGLSTSLPSLRANLLLSTGVAATGICLPIALSFILVYITDATPLQCFAAGAALCSTSLGTTFTVLGTSGLVESRLGVVLTSAAMMDDVVGLVMVQIISNLGRSGASFDAIVVVRPLLVSLGFAIAAPLICIFIASPMTKWLNGRREENPQGNLNRIMQKKGTAFVLHTLILIAYIASASYVGTSNLYAAYIAGASISWWDSSVDHTRSIGVEESGARATIEVVTVVHPNRADDSSIDTSGLGTYEGIYSVAVNRVLRPFFFLFCGMWLFRLPGRRGAAFKKQRHSNVRQSAIPDIPATTILTNENDALVTTETAVASRATGRDVSTPSQAQSRINKHRPTNLHTVAAGTKPLSIYPASILGCAMMARGEIGFLISSIAESEGIFRDDGEVNSNSKLFLCVTWAIVLCTVVGPLATSPAPGIQPAPLYFSTTSTITDAISTIIMPFTMSTWNKFGLGIAAGFAGLSLLSAVRPQELDDLFGVTQKAMGGNVVAGTAAVDHRTVGTLVGGRDLAFGVSIFLLGRARKNEEMGVVILSLMCVCIPDVWLAWRNKKHQE